MSAKAAKQIEDAVVDGLHLAMKGYTGEHRLLLAESGPSRVWAHALDFAKANGHTVPGAYAAKAVAAVKRVGNVTDYQAFVATERAHIRAAGKILAMRRKLGERGRLNGVPVICSAPLAMSGIQHAELNPLIVDFAGVFSAGTGNLHASAPIAIRALIDATRPPDQDLPPNVFAPDSLRVLACTYSESGRGFDGLISMSVEEWAAWADVAERHAAAIELHRKQYPEIVDRWWS